MAHYMVRRALLLIPTLVLVTVAVFGLMRLVPGDVVVAKVGASGNPANIATVRHELGLDRPMYVQYFDFVGGLLSGNPPASLWTTQPVSSAFFDALPVTAELGLAAIVLSIVISIPIGLISAIFQDRPIDHVARVIAILGISLPDFWLATMLIVILSTQFGYSPPLQYQSLSEAPWHNFQQFVFPAIILGYAFSALSSRMIRSSMIEVLRQDYIRTAYAKGLRQRIVLYRHAAKNAFIPVLTIWGNSLGLLLSGTVILETIFSLPGIGQQTFTAIQQRDYTQLQFNVLMIALVIMFVNLAVDILYGVVDPRIRYR